MKKNRLTIFGIFFIFGCASFFYLFGVNSHCKFISVTFDSFRLPVIEMEIEGKPYPLVIDLGSSAQLSLDTEVLEKINKKKWCESYFLDYKGIHYKTPNYLLPSVKLGETLLYEVMSEERNENFFNNTIIISSTEKSDNTPTEEKGTIGWPLLKRKNLLLDFPRSRIAIVDSAKQIDHLLKDMLKVPFKITKSGVTITVETDIGEMRLVLDTGASFICIRSSQYDGDNRKKDSRGREYFSTSQFEIEGKNFGRESLYLLDITPKMKELDGCLGMDFLKYHTVYIDFRKNLLYISD